LFADRDRLDGSRDVRDFVLVGERMVEWLVSLGLEPSHRVLEVCGRDTGRGHLGGAFGRPGSRAILLTTMGSLDD
jgi:hypothetical protein